METMITITRRQSCRFYEQEQITDDELQTILKAANAAPVAFGKYGNLMLTVVQNEDMLQKIDLAGSEYYGRPNFKIRFDAPTVIIVSAKTNREISDNLRSMSNNHDDGTGAYCDTGCIMENMALAATNLGLGSVYLYGAAVAIANSQELCSNLNIPEGFKPLSVLPVGHAAKPFKERELSLDKLATNYIR